MKQNKNTTKTQGVDVEKLLAAREISNAAVKGALDKLAEQKKAAEEARIIENIAYIQRNTETAVVALRTARKTEKAAKAYLQGIANAEQAFYTNANVDTYMEAVAKAEQERRNILRS